MMYRSRAYPRHRPSVRALALALLALLPELILALAIGWLYVAAALS